MMFYKIYGSRWSTIAYKFPGMTENDIKNKFYSTLKSVASKFQDPADSFPRHKKELVKFVDIAIMYDEFLPCKRNCAKVNRKRSKQKVITSSILRESNTEAVYDPLKNLKLSIWSKKNTTESDVLSKAISQMVWNEHNKDTGNTKLDRINYSESKEEIKFSVKNN